MQCVLRGWVLSKPHSFYTGGNSSHLWMVLDFQEVVNIMMNRPWKELWGGAGVEKSILLSGIACHWAISVVRMTTVKNSCFSLTKALGTYQPLHLHYYPSSTYHSCSKRKKQRLRQAKELFEVTSLAGMQPLRYKVWEIFGCEDNKVIEKEKQIC